MAKKSAKKVTRGRRPKAKPAEPESVADDVTPVDPAPVSAHPLLGSRVVLSRHGSREGEVLGVEGDEVVVKLRGSILSIPHGVVDTLRVPIADVTVPGASR